MSGTFFPEILFVKAKKALQSVNKEKPASYELSTNQFGFILWPLQLITTQLMTWALKETSLHAASVSVCFWSGIFGFGCVRNGTRAKKWKRGRGGEGRKHLQTNPGILKTTLASRWGVWLARLVEHNLHVNQRFVSYLEAVTSTLIFCRICFWSARFALWCTSFWNVELFLQLNRGYRGSIFSKVVPWNVLSCWA